MSENGDKKDHSDPVPAKAAIGGHPIHPALIPFPIAFLVGAFVTDVVYLSTSEMFWARMSYWLLVGGVVTGVVAALPGLVDFLGIGRAREHAAGWIHFLGNLAMLGVAGANWFLRLGDPAPGALEVVLSGLTAGLLAVTGWYGGELAYRHLIGPTGHD